MSKNKGKPSVTPVAVMAVAEPRKRRTLAHDAHWAEWQKRHRAPRASDLLRKIRSEEAKHNQPIVKNELAIKDIDDDDSLSDIAPTVFDDDFETST
jgi:hypothetical protein